MWRLADAGKNEGTGGCWDDIEVLLVLSRSAWVGVLFAAELLLLTIEPFIKTPLLTLLVLELFNIEKLPPAHAETFATLLLLLLVLLLLLPLEVGVLCAFGTMPFDWGERTVDGSIDSEPIALGNPVSNCGSLLAPWLRGVDSSFADFGVTGLLFSLNGLVLELGVINMLSSRIRAGLLASRLPTPPPLPGPIIAPLVIPVLPFSTSFGRSLDTLQFSLLLELLSIISVE